MEQEYNRIIEKFGYSETNLILGDLDSYKDIRIQCSYIEVIKELEMVMDDTWTIYGSNIY